MDNVSLLLDIICLPIADSHLQSIRLARRCSTSPPPPSTTPISQPHRRIIQPHHPTTAESSKDNLSLLLHRVQHRRLGPRRAVHAEHLRRHDVRPQQCVYLTTSSPSPSPSTPLSAAGACIDLGLSTLMWHWLAARQAYILVCPAIQGRGWAYLVGSSTPETVPYSGSAGS